MIEPIDYILPALSIVYPVTYPSNTFKIVLTLA